jgi:predicted RNA-binding protein with PUA-like domain
MALPPGAIGSAVREEKLAWCTSGVKGLLRIVSAASTRRNKSSPFSYWHIWLRVGAMADHYLLKTEPSEYSFADLQRDKATVWDGVSNPVALRNLREMKPGAQLIIYETGSQKLAVGTAKVISVEISNPKEPEIEIQAGKALAKPVSLAEIKANKLFADSPLVRQGRLSVVPLTPEQYNALTARLLHLRIDLKRGAS